MEKVTFIDTTYAIHNNIRSHTGSIITFSTVVFVSESKIQKLNTQKFNRCRNCRSKQFITKGYIFAFVFRGL